ncbi:MAG: FecR family protein [Desulfarculales bacterium]|jgi:hypothetical protein|nr:FecR family protein [Desulfarculales bacterium]
MTIYFERDILSRNSKFQIKIIQFLSGIGIKRLFSLVCSWAVLFLPGAALAAQAGQVLSLTPGAFAERNGVKIPLELQAGIFEGDALVTDASGRLRVLMSDDTALNLGANTAFTIESYTAEGDNPAFTGHMAHGLLRALTGNITALNPQGFSVTTPEATVGIRGTVITLRSANGRSTVFVENTMRQVVVNGVNVPTGNKIVIAPGFPPAVQPIAPQDRREIGRDLAAAGQMPVAAAAPEPGMAVAEASSATLAVPAALAGAGGPALTALALNDMTTLNGMTASPTMPAPAMPAPATGTVTGALTTSLLTAAYAWSGSFAFDVDLNSGSVANASMNLAGTLGQDLDGGGYTPLGTTIDLYNGGGNVTGNNFSIAGFSGTTNWRGTTYPAEAYNMIDPTDSYRGPYAAMDGTISRSGANASVSGNYIINAPGSWSTAISGDRGTFTGSGQLQ